MNMIYSLVKKIVCSKKNNVSLPEFWIKYSGLCLMNLNQNIIQPFISSSNKLKYMYCSLFQWILMIQMDVQQQQQQQQQKQQKQQQKQQQQ